MTTEERLERIERKLAAVKNRSKRLWLVLILFGAGILITGAVTTGGDVIGAREFRVVDKEGNARAWLGITEGGSRLVLFNEEGLPRAILSVFEGEQGLSLFDEKGKIRATLSVTGGLPGLGLHDEESNPRTSLRITELGPELIMLDEEGWRVWSAP